ncbi:hypothetical protein Tco_1359384 [Tanacetum coccineum]
MRTHRKREEHKPLTERGSDIAAILWPYLAERPDDIAGRTRTAIHAVLRRMGIKVGGVLSGSDVGGATVRGDSGALSSVSLGGALWVNKH